MPRATGIDPLGGIARAILEQRSALIAGRDPRPYQSLRNTDHGVLQQITDWLRGLPTEEVMKRPP
jgi:hypothetical protein